MSNKDVADQVLADYYKKMTNPQISVINLLQNKDFNKIIEADTFLANKILKLYKLNSLPELKDALIAIGNDIEYLNEIKVKTPEKIKLYHYGRISAFVDMSLAIINFQEDYSKFVEVITNDQKYFKIINLLSEYNMLSTNEIAEKLNISPKSIVYLYNKYKQLDFINTKKIGRYFVHSLSFKTYNYLKHYKNETKFLKED